MASDEENAAATPDCDSITAEALEFITPWAASPLAPLRQPSALLLPIDPKNRRKNRYDGLCCIDSVASLKRHKCLRFLCASARLGAVESDPVRSPYRTLKCYDAAIADIAKQWCKDEDRRRREEADEMAQCTFHPDISQMSKDIQRAPATFYKRGLEWLSHREQKLKKLRAKEDAERAEQEEEIMRPYQMCSESRALLAEADENRSTTPRVRIAYRDPFDFQPHVTEPVSDAMRQRLEARGPVFDRLLQPRGKPQSETQESRRRMSPSAQRQLIRRLHDSDVVRRHGAVKAGVEKRNAEFSFRPTICSRSASTTVRRHSCVVEDPDPPTSERKLSEGELISFIVRQQMWNDKRKYHLEARRVVQHREISTAYPFAPRLHRVSDESVAAVARRWELETLMQQDSTSRPPEPPSRRRENSKKVLPVDTMTPMKVHDSRERSDRNRLITADEIRDWFARLDTGYCGFVPLELAVAAIEALSDAISIPLNFVDASAEFATRIGLADFELLVHRLLLPQ